MKRKKLLMGNWKMNHTIHETRDFCEEVKTMGLMKKARNKGVILGIAPSYTCLQAAQRHAHGLIISSQDVHHQDHGAYTGNVSIEMLKDVNIDWSLVGHSERRTYEGETSFNCNRKIRALMKNGFHALYCVGETLKEYESGLTKDVIKEQITVGLQNLDKHDVQNNIVIAYEPVWSIGTGKNASVEIAQDICSYIRGLVHELYGKVAAIKILILYGGSVKPENIHAYMSASDVDGALVGGASLKAESFKALLDNL